ncbi:prevent-host-death family protein [Schaalia sp. lx-260]|uniref:prevent-host-death family protein n=1 Tax=Schaalia sp. lx-260 TaxID=2899082 RepID=UPI001E590B10|nr:prevent-host-death family protein [Schaalia sp. lx-260]
MPTFFSRPTSVNTRHADTAATEKSLTSDRPFAMNNAIEQWRDDLARITADEGGDSAPRLTIGTAHPGGLAQLYAHHTTRLSNLVREPASQQRAMERARTIIARAEDLTIHHGVGPVHLSIGRASWTQNGQRMSSAVFLRPLHLEKDGDDVLLTLRSGTTLAPVIHEALTASGVHIDLEKLLTQATTVHGFSSTKALAALREAASRLENFNLTDELILGIFEHPASTLLRELTQSNPLLSTPLIRALAGEVEAQKNFAAPLPEPNPHDRDPWKERGAGDLTPQQQDVVETVAAGRSLVINVPEGADGGTILGALLADAAAHGRSTLHIAGSPSRTARAEARLRELGLDEIAVRIDGSTESADIMRDRLTGAIVDTTGVEDPAQVDDMRKQLVQVRHMLSQHMTHLHKPFHEFGVSAFDALQVLTDLTGAHPKPRTKVRLREEVLLDIASDRGERARTLLHRAATLGIFSRSTTHGAWKGIVINSHEQVEEILTRVQRLSKETLPALQGYIAAVARETKIRPAESMAAWEAQLAMFAGVRDVLQVFQPKIFERSAADMVFATASRQWRNSHGISMSRAARGRLVKQAKEMLRPGITVKDLHKELLLVQERRDVWRHHCDADGWPTLPQHMDEILQVTQQVRDDFEWLSPIFSTVHPEMLRMPLDEVTRIFDRLAADPEGAHELPKRVAVLKALTDLGLDGLTQDLRQRHIQPEHIDAELDLAWWASILALMIAADPSLGGFDPVHLETALAQGRDLDKEQVATLAPQTISQLRRMRRTALAGAPDAQTDIQTVLAGNAHPADVYAQHPLVRRLIPVALTVPTLVPWILPGQARIDLLILDDIDMLPLAELIPIIARAEQVVLIADVDSARVGEAVQQIASVLPTMHIRVAPTRLNDQVALLLARHGIGHTGVPIPWTTATAPVTALWTEGTGMPAPGAHAVESTSQEVSAVVESVVAHAVEQPERSLMVIALNTRHAERIKDAIHRAIATEVGVASFFDQAVVEPFVVVDPQQARGLSRDRVIISVGFAKTPHGRILHDFGIFSTPQGVKHMCAVLSCVRGDMTIISSVRSEEIDRARVSAQGAQMLVDLLEIAQGQSGRGNDAWPTLEAAPDRLLVDLAERLYGMGLEVVPNVGIPGGLRIPLAIGHPEVPGRLLVAVLTDDEEYVAEPSLRMRDRLLPAMLEAQGWKVYTALSMPVFIDPGKEADSIVQLVLDAVDEVNDSLIQEVEVPQVDDDIVEETVISVVPSQAEREADGLRLRHDEVSQEVLAHALPTEKPLVVTPSLSARSPRPPIAQGLPLAAYGDDQLDELALWVRSDGVERTDDELVEELRSALDLRRRGAQSDAVLRNVVRRTAPTSQLSQESQQDAGVEGNADHYE